MTEPPVRIPLSTAAEGGHQHVRPSVCQHRGPAPGLPQHAFGQARALLRRLPRLHQPGLSPDQAGGAGHAGWQAPLSAAADLRW